MPVLTDEELEYKVLLGDLRDLVKLPHGRKILWHILSMCGLYNDTFTGNSQTFFYEGKRSVGLEIIAFMEEADPTMYASLLLERSKYIKEKTND